MGKVKYPKVVIEPFNYEGVQLLNGRLKNQFEQIRDFYYALRANDILYSFRLRAGIKHPPGKNIGGAAGRAGLTFGQWIGAFARMYKATDDTALRDKAIYLMDEWAKTIDKDGYFLPFEFGEHAHYHYIYDKFVQGLVDIYEYIGCERALQYLERITDWAEENLGRSNPYALPTEWYTLSENLYRAYELTGEKRYFDFAKVWEYTDYWRAFARNEDIFRLLEKAEEHKSYHAYSHVNSLCSAAMAYKVTGERHYLDTIINAYRFLQETQCFATGGYGPEEQLIVPDGLPETLIGIRRGESNVDVRFHFETACGSWAAFKLSRYLMMFTGEAFYGDWIERLIYNGVGALVPMNDYGMIMYGSAYHLYGAQKSLFTVWFCCSGTLPLCVADYHNLIYFHDDENLYINLFVPSKVEWNGPDCLVRVVQETRFPEEGKVLIHVDPKTRSRFGLKFRVPLWAQNGVQVKINNVTSEIETVPGKWATIKREWSLNDTVTLKFDLSPRLEPLSRYASPVAVLCGPVVMVMTTAREDENSIPTEGNLRFPADWLVDAGGRIAYLSSIKNKYNIKAPLDPSRELHTNQVFRPYYEVKAGEYYRMYFERAGDTSIFPNELVFHGNWLSNGTVRYAEEPGSYFEGKFKGTTLVWEGLRWDDAGIAEVSIDGRKVAEVDQYGYTGVHVGRLDQREVPFRWTISGLDRGEHTIRVAISTRKNPASRGTKINVKRLIAYP